jgi:hypothetical protein
MYFTWRSIYFFEHISLVNMFCFFSLLPIFTLFCQLRLTSYFWRNLMYHNKYTRMSLYIYVLCINIFLLSREWLSNGLFFLKFPLPKTICNSLVILRAIWYTKIFHFFIDHLKNILSSANDGAFHLSNSMIHTKISIFLITRKDCGQCKSRNFSY